MKKKRCLSRNPSTNKLISNTKSRMKLNLRKYLTHPNRIVPAPSLKHQPAALLTLKNFSTATPIKKIK